MDIIKAYFKDIKDNKGLDKDTTRELAIRAQNGDLKALDLVVKNHLLLVAKEARKYIDKGVPFADLLAEGNMGLLKAVEKWDSTKGASFTTCATWWIKQIIIRNCMHSNRIVRLPEHVSELMRTNRIDFTYGEINIDQPNSEGNTLADSIPEQEEDLFQDENVIEKKQIVKKLLTNLKPREQEVINLHFGLSGYSSMNIKDIAEHLSLTTTRINQLLRSSIKKMKESKIKI
jgi:RNA polymerase sigma factor (sigma-70 family)